MTNGDKIRSMSNEELANFIYDTSESYETCDRCAIGKGIECPDNCTDGIMLWINQEVTE